MKRKELIEKYVSTAKHIEALNEELQNLSKLIDDDIKLSHIIGDTGIKCSSGEVMEFDNNGVIKLRAEEKIPHSWELEEDE